jgi:hypothetical protein
MWLTVVECRDRLEHYASGRIISLRYYKGTVKGRLNIRGNNFVTRDTRVGQRLDGFMVMHNNAV